AAAAPPPAPPPLPSTTLFRSGRRAASRAVGGAAALAAPGPLASPRALPAMQGRRAPPGGPGPAPHEAAWAARAPSRGGVDVVARSEEHTSELQSRENLVCRLL